MEASKVLVKYHPLELFNICLEGTFQVFFEEKAGIVQPGPQDPLMALSKQGIVPGPDIVH